MKIKRILYLAVLLCLLMGILPAAATETPVTSGTFGKNDTLSWSFRDGTLTITGSGEIPDFTFLSLAPWKHLQESITAVEIGNGITRIGDDAFGQYASLQRVNIGSGVKSIGTGAFQLCTALQSVTIPDSVSVIENSAFDNCESVTSLTLGSGLTSIGSSAFSDNYSLKTIIIPDSVITLGAYAFQNGTSLESVDIGDSVISIGTSAFHGCNKLKTVTFGDNVKTIGSYAFNNCYALTDVIFPETLESIGEWAFSDCTSMTALTLPGSMRTVGNYAFIGCTGISKLTIRSGLESIGSGAFKGCSAITAATIPDSVTHLGSSAFHSCTSLQNVTLGSGLTAIINYTFQDCKSLKNVEMGNNVTSIGASVFYNCAKLAKINLSTSLVSIGDHAFANCNALAKIEFPPSLKKIDDWAFFDCLALEAVTIPGSVETVGNHAFIGCEGLTTVKIEEGVLSIGSGAFQGCSKLGMDLNPDHPINANWVEIPDSVTYLGSSAFSGCTLMEKIILGNGLTEIGSHTFKNCDSLFSVRIPDSVTTVGGSVFTDCDSLRCVFFGKSVQTVGSYLFIGSDLVNSVWFRGDAPEIDKNAFLGITAEGTYYAGNTTWTEEKKQNYGGKITWIGNWSEDFIDDSLTGEELNERYIRITAYAREGEAGIGRKLKDATLQSSGESKLLADIHSIARNEASRFGVILRNEGYQDYVIPAAVAASLQGSDGKAHEFTALMKKFPVFGKKTTYISTVFGRNHGTGESYMELRGTRLVLSPSIGQDLIVSARGFSTTSVMYTVGIPGNQMLQLSSPTGVFTNENLWNLAQNSNVLYVWAAAQTTGEETDPIPFYISRAATNTELEKQLKNGEISLLGEDGFKIKLGGNSELFEGMELDLADFEMPVGYFRSGNTIKLTLGIDLFDNGDSSKEKESKWQAVKSMVLNRGSRRKKAGEAIEAFDQWYSEMKQLAEKNGKFNYIPWQSSTAKDFDFKIGFMGYAQFNYINGQWVLVDGALGLDGKFKLSHDVQVYVGTPVPIPVNGSIQGGAEINVAGHGIKGVPVQGAPLQFELTLGITPELSVHAGLGIKDALSGGFYGEGKLPIKLTVSNRHLTVAAKGEIGAEAECFVSSGKKVLLEIDEIMLIDRYFGVSARAVALNSGSTETLTTVMSRDYADNTSQWLGGVDHHAASTMAAESAAAAGVSFQTLQESIFSNSQPQLAAVGDGMLLVWSEDCADRNTYNRMRMVYSLYDPVSGSWSAPLPVWDDGCNDGYARLVSDGENVWLLWQKVKTALTEKTAADFSFIQANAELCLARFDTAAGTFTDARMITDNNLYEYTRHLYLDNGIPCVLWASAAENALNIAGIHTITGWRNGNSETLAEDLNYVLSIDAQGQEITYVSDGDGDLSSTADITAFIMTQSGTAACDNGGSAMTYASYASLAGQQTLFLSDMNNIRYRQDGQWKTVFAEDRTLGGNMQIAETALGTTILWTEAEDGGNALYSVHFRNGSWSDPIRISDSSRILSKLSVICYQGKLTGICNAVSVTYDSESDTYTKGNTDLTLFQANPFTDIALNYILPVDETTLIRGEDAQLQLSVSNLGTTDIRRITFTLTDTLGTQSEQTLELDLPSGESDLVSIAYPVPENYAATTLTVTATVSGTDADPEDNTQTLELGLADLALTNASVEILDDAYLFKVIMANNSLVDAENLVLEMRMDEEDSAPFLLREVPVIRSGEYAALHVIVPEKAFVYDRNGLAYVYVSLNANGTDASEGNNTLLLLVEEITQEPLPEIVTKGDLDLDGDVDAYDLTALARHVGGIEHVSGQALLNADVDQDGDVDAYDLTKHARYVGGIITGWDQE